MFLIVAAVLAASPTNLKAVMSSAMPGDTIKLAATSFPGLTRVQRRSWTPAVIFDATDATLESVTVAGTTGVVWRGGTFVGTSVNGYGVGNGMTISQSQNVSIEGARLSGSRNGVVVDRSDGVRVVGNTITHMSSDGIDIALSRNVVVDRNSCADFAFSPGAHADCIQMWSRPVAAPTADVVISNNRVNGDMQGIFLGDHVRDGVPDGGFDRVTIRGNTVLNTFGGATVVANCRGCTVRDNNVNSLPNYRHKAQLYITGGSVVACGNVVPMMPKQGSPPCTN